jgi:phosphatidylserine decarboxylase
MIPTTEHLHPPKNYAAKQLLPMDPHITDIQPGGGVVIGLEQSWGRVRRAWLRTFRPSYVRRMEACRQGDFNPCPHPVLDPRDLKFYRNQGGYYWLPKDDPFTWRSRLPFARDGLAELLLMGGGLLAATILLAWGASTQTGVVSGLLWLFSLTAAVLTSLIVWFFRNPSRPIPTDPQLVVAPADGTISDIEAIAHDDFIGGPALKVGIFLSIFNVHINRAPVACRVIGLKYQPGKYLNALRPESARENEQVAVLIEADVGCRPMIVRQITGAIARRIVCWVKPGDRLSAGEQFGMIKLGSRTEILVPHEAGLEVLVRKGDKIKAGTSLLLRLPKLVDNG